ncbi:MAG: Holliday junction resolvase RuvX [Coriobacteriia bacterium]|nr:Holliday junction resolvase RuvX [Coriobacteriia bacterium]
MALDIGEKRVGIAISDPAGLVAMPLAVLGAPRLLGDGAELKRLLSDYDDVGLVIVGLPMTMGGLNGPQADRVRVAGERVAELTRLPVRFVDERLSSVEAKRRMAEAGASARAQRGSVDMVAASLVLQSFLDSERNEQDRHSTQGGRDGESGRGGENGASVHDRWVP